ncbi:MAG: transposase [Kiritimatiellales bacterium]
MDVERKENLPRRQRRLDRLFKPSSSYFVTLCTANRMPVLDNAEIFDRVRAFVSDSMERYSVYIDSYVLMPDHAHLIITIAGSSAITLGAWVKAFKAMVAVRQFKWQSGFFDHVLRSSESRSEKWEYIRMNPVRAGLVNVPEEWSYAQKFNQYNGSEL